MSGSLLPPWRDLAIARMDAQEELIRMQEKAIKARDDLIDILSRKLYRERVQRALHMSSCPALGETTRARWDERLAQVVARGEVPGEKR